MEILDKKYWKRREKFIWEVIKHIDKKCCNGCLKIKELDIFQRHKMPNRKPAGGYYNPGTRTIGLKQKWAYNGDVKGIFIFLAHELAHAYQCSLDKDHIKKNKSLSFIKINKSMHNKEHIQHMAVIAREMDKRYVSTGSLGL